MFDTSNKVRKKNFDIRRNALFGENVIKKLYKYLLYLRTKKFELFILKKFNIFSKVLINTALLQKHRVYNRSNFRHEGYYYVDTIKPPYNKRQHHVNYKLHATME